MSVIFGLICLVLILPVHAKATKPDSAKLEFVHCNYRDIYYRGIRCARLHTDSQVGKFNLPVVILPAIKANNSNEAVMYIPGGPGEGFQVTEDNIDYWIEWMQEAKFSRDLVIYDPRGVGQSEPTWSCQEYDELSERLIGENLSIEQELKKSNPILTRCLADFAIWTKQQVQYTGDRHPALALYSSFNQARDLTDLIKALPYKSVHLWGISYGTRVAMLAAHQAKVKSIILDSPYLINKGKISEWPALLNNALQLHNKIYKKLYRKQGKLKDFNSLWKLAVKKLDSQPQTYILQSIDNDDLNFPIVLNSDRLMSILYFTLYNESLWHPFYQALEYLIYEADETDQNNNQLESLQLILETFIEYNFDKEFNSMIFYATECSDNSLVTEAEYQVAVEKFPHITRFTQYDWQYDVCRLPVFDQRKAIYTFDLARKKTVILGGQFDPVTPARWGRELHKVLGKFGKSYTIAGASHGVTVSGVCDPGVIEALINQSKIKIKNYCPDVKLKWP